MRSDQNQSLNSLIAKLEAAEGPSRELDALIFCAVSPGAKLAGDVVPNAQCPTADVWLPGEDGGRGSITIPPAYTASTDAALTLVSLNHRPVMGMYVNPLAGKTAWAEVMGEDLFVIAESNGRGLAIALCAAALKARSLSTTEENNG